MFRLSLSPPFKSAFSSRGLLSSFSGGRGYESRWECYRGWWKTEGEEQESVVTSICWKAVMLCVRLEEEAAGHVTPVEAFGLEVVVDRQRVAGNWEKGTRKENGQATRRVGRQLRG
ncbi:hypothetical protein OIU74_006427 [Salix koriyanagi]|uniref:Uncharacterized protein n=1 Tax=Salix koriyanagi TaxID=2511006 RepID=A0A9Q0UE33_9ROSI|nr:hypothetical protein OIU74_006427 [Salix koriyanagi]